MDNMVTENAERRLLVIDDDAGVCELISDVAEDMGFTVRQRLSPDELWGDLSGFDPDVLVLDLDLPHVDGVRLLGMLGEGNARQDILLISGLDNRTLATAQRIGRENGLSMIGVLHKPFAVHSLEVALGLLLAADAPADENELADAIDVGEVVVHYQPKVSLDTSGEWRFHSAEALVRWQHPRLGFIHPDSFIPMAEETGLVLPLTRYVLEDAARRLSEWDAEGLDGAISVNLSPLLLGRSQLPDEIADVLSRHRADPHRLILEVTESAAMQNVAKSAEVLTRFRIKGYGLALDDFGTGYSSLIHLHRLPFNELKIDKSFVQELEENSESETIVTSIIGLGHSLGLEVCAEGVETHAILRKLSDLGCDLFQGYYIARPGPPEEIVDMFRGDETLT